MNFIYLTVIDTVTSFFPLESPCIEEHGITFDKIGVLISSIVITPNFTFGQVS